MENRCPWRQSRQMRILLLMFFAASCLPTLIHARSLPEAGSDFPGDDVLALGRTTASSLQPDRLQFGTIIAACSKHHIACHRLRGHFATSVQPPLSSGGYGRDNERLLLTYSTQDYEYEGTDTNPTIVVPNASSPTYSPVGTWVHAPPQPSP